MMEEAALTYSTETWLELCAANSIPAMRANTIHDIFEDPQLKETLFETRELETEGAYRAMRPGLRFSKTPATIRREPPQIGRDTAEVLAEVGLKVPTPQAG
jgi:crotonobetainyl-CoA:carnitine CoA-transferase CaiB-like acyl-CoA transferase